MTKPRWSCSWRALCTCVSVFVRHCKSCVAKRIRLKHIQYNISLQLSFSIFFLFYFFCAYYIRFKSQPSRRFADKLICGEQVMMICDKSSNDAKCGFCRRRSSDSLSVTPVLRTRLLPSFFFCDTRDAKGRWLLHCAANPPALLFSSPPAPSYCL